MAWVFDIQRFCLHDGPGLRTTVFFKGCPLRCRWCSNPESQRQAADLMHNAARCMACGACAAACPHGLIATKERGGPELDRKACVACGACCDVCPTGAMFRKGRDMTVDEIVAAALRDSVFYAHSGGGLTVSGGEPLAQPDFLLELLGAAKDAALNTAMETTLHADWAVVERCLPFLDHVFFDVKHPDSALHAAGAGVGLEKILPNAGRLCRVHPDPHPRIPVIPGYNTSEKAMEGFAELIAGFGRPVELLPYHALGEGKYSLLGKPYPGDDIPADKGLEYAKLFQNYLRGRGIDADIHA